MYVYPISSYSNDTMNYNLRSHFCVASVSIKISVFNPYIQVSTKGCPRQLSFVSAVSFVTSESPYGIFINKVHVTQTCWLLQLGLIFNARQNLSNQW